MAAFFCATYSHTALTREADNDPFSIFFIADSQKGKANRHLAISLKQEESR
jgi:hypothetical protein